MFEILDNFERFNQKNEIYCRAFWDPSVRSQQTDLFFKTYREPLEHFREVMLRAREAAGNLSVRFCHYGHAGNFRRSPLMMSPDEIDMMREALHETPELRELLRRLVED